MSDILLREKWFYSQGAWAINTVPDMKSYIGFRYGINEWGVQKMLINKGINTKMTIGNIISKIDDDITYYYNDHINDKNGMENCNTALQNTIVEYH